MAATSSTVRKLRLGSQGLEVSAQGLGCMGMSAFCGPPKPDQDMISLIHHAVFRGITFLDTSDVYGPFTNEVIFERICEIVSKKQCSPSQLALAWVHYQGDDVAPIPGTTKVKNLEENIGALSVELTPLEMKELEDLVSSAGVFGDRYDDMDFTWVNAETPPLSSWQPVV